MARIAIIGGGPAGLFAAEHLAGLGHTVTVFDRMPTVARKFLMAGLGGLNLTHGEPFDRFTTRYGEAAPAVRPLLAAFPPGDLRQWAHGLGEETFEGTSGRVFPRSFKASPLLRAWLRRLGSLGVTIRPRHLWTGWSAAGELTFSTPDGPLVHGSDATILALGGASWPRLGSDGGWVGTLAAQGVAVEPLKPANCGFTLPWSDVFRSRFEGAALKRIAVAAGGRTVRGEAIVTATGIEGGAIYAHAAAIREELARNGRARIAIDLRPDLTQAAMSERLGRAKAGDSFSNRLRKQLALPPVAIGLVHEADRLAGRLALEDLARLIKAVPLAIDGVQPIDRAISTAGGVRWSELDENLMLRRSPGVFCAGEMIDWEAPTGGYLLQGCFALGLAAARGAARWLNRSG